MDWGIVAGIASAVIALASLVFSIKSFGKQQNRAEAHARGNVKPLLRIKSQKYEDMKSICLTNDGVGPAIITVANFRKSSTGKSTNSVVELFNLGIKWETFRNLPLGRAIPPQTEVILVKQSLEHLVKQGLDEKAGLDVLVEWQKQKSGIEVEIEYEDILGNKQLPYKETLS